MIGSSLRMLLAALPASLVAIAALAAIAVADAGASTLPPGFRDDAFLTDLKEPTQAAFAPDGRIFVSEKSGKIVVYDNLADSEKTEIADLAKQVYDTGDRGLLSIALDPDFPAQPYVYALYTFDHVINEDPAGFFPHWGEGPDYVGDPCVIPPGSTADVCPVSGRLVRLTVADDGEADAVVESGGEPLEHALIPEEWCQQFSSHSIGDLQFAADGSLYVSGGDGASFNVPDYGQFGFPGKENLCGDPPGDVGDILTPPSAEGGALRSQDLRTPYPHDPTELGGTVLRIDPETGEGLPGNPMFGSLDQNERRIIAYGYRNPFRFSLDEQSDHLYVSNVGWGLWEEIDRIPMLPNAPPNSGWPCSEGPVPNEGYESLGLTLCEGIYDEAGSTVPPLFFYRHGTDVLPGDGCRTEFGSAVAANHLYRGDGLPEQYDGAFFFADTVRACIYVMYPDHDGVPDPETTELFLGDGGIYPGADIFTGPDGNLFYLSFYGEADEGSLHRVSYDPASPIARIEASKEWGSLPLQVEFDASASTDPGNLPLSYEWDFDGNGSFETKDFPADPTRNKTFNANSNVTVSVRVGNGTKSSIARIKIFPGNTPPEPIIEAPDPTFTWGVGQTVELDGYAFDPDEPGDEVEEKMLRWKTQLLHCPGACHAHPLRVFPGTSFGELTAPDHDYPARLRITFTATDSRGLTVSKSVEIEPRTVALTIESSPPGLEISAGPDTDSTPFVLTAIENSVVVLSAPSTALIEGGQWPFMHWSDGGERVHSLIAEESGTYTAFYEQPDPGDPGDPGDGGGGNGGGGGDGGGQPPQRAPQTTIQSKPPKQAASRTARFVFSADPAGASFRCKLDKLPYRSCRSPRVYRNLALGKHVLRVQAIAADGTAEVAPAIARWKVLPPTRR
jgi:glucose/arabinose dehydrogenase